MAGTVTAAPVPATSPPDRALIDKYCVTCHNPRTKAGGLLLDKADIQDLRGSAATWEKVVRKLRGGTMPPAVAPKPPQAELAAFLTSLENALDAVNAASPNPGRPLIHRLNRTEYTNAVRDLLHLEINGRELLPADDTSYGFDNIADALTVSPRLLERYLVVAKYVSRMALGDPSIPTVSVALRPRDSEPGRSLRPRAAVRTCGGGAGRSGVRHPGA